MNIHLVFVCLGALFAISSTPAMAAAPTQPPAFIQNLSSPVGMIYDRQGILHVAEWSAGRVSAFDAQGKRSVVTEAVQGPSGLAFDTEGTLYIASYSSGSIYRMKKGGKPEVLAKGFSSPAGILWSNENDLLVANRNAGEIVRVALDGSQRVISRGHKTPAGLVQMKDGSIFVSCLGGGIDRITPDGRSSTIYTGLNSPGPGMIADGNAVLVVDYGGTTLTRVDAGGNAVTVADALRSPAGLARMPDGRVVVGAWGDSAAHIIDLATQ